ncbi:MAG: hypothetical protein U0228_29710 [Myxococcaceae bacterium]
MRTFFVVVAAGLTAGCASISNVQTADTLGKGNFQVSAEAGALGVGNTTLPSGTGTQNPLVVPHVDVSGRFGISEGVDLGLRAGMSFLEAQAKFLFTTPGAPIAVSLAPTFGGLVLGSGGATGGVGLGILNIGIPVLIGFKTRGGSEFVLGPRLQNLIAFTSGTGTSTVYGLGAGGSLGFFLRVSDNFGLMPEASLVVPVVGASAFATQIPTASTVNAGVVMFQFKLGVMIGRFRPGPDSPPPMPKPVRGAPRPGPPPGPGEVPIANQPLPMPEPQGPPPPPPPSN